MQRCARQHGSSGTTDGAVTCAAASQLVTNGENGALAPVGDHAAFVRLAMAWAGHPRAACAMGLAARRSALALDWEHIVRQIEIVQVAAMQAGDSRRPTAALAADWK